MELSEIRQHLDRLDKALVELVAERQSFVPKVAEFKKANGLARFQPEREEEIISSKRKLAEAKGVDPDLVEDLFRRIILDSHRIEGPIIGA